MLYHGLDPNHDFAALQTVPSRWLCFQQLILRCVRPSGHLFAPKKGSDSHVHLHSHAVKSSRNNMSVINGGLNSKLLRKAVPSRFRFGRILSESSNGWLDLGLPDQSQSIRPLYLDKAAEL